LICPRGNSLSLDDILIDPVNPEAHSTQSPIPVYETPTFKNKEGNEYSVGMQSSYKDIKPGTVNVDPKNKSQVDISRTTEEGISKMM
jgi:hypothetical protein